MTSSAENQSAATRATLILMILDAMGLIGNGFGKQVATNLNMVKRL